MKRLQSSVAAKVSSLKPHEPGEFKEPTAVDKSKFTSETPTKENHTLEGGRRSRIVYNPFHPSLSRFHQLSALFLLLVLSVPANAEVYNVGPGEPLLTPSDVPWESLHAGDKVRIHWRPEPYRNKWIVYGQGTLKQPIIVEGIPGPDGQLPIIDGNNATTRKQLNYTHAQRSVIKIGSAYRPESTVAKHIWIRRLDIRNARPPFGYRNRFGSDKYLKFAAGIFIHDAEHVRISHCTIRDNCLGINSTPFTRHLLVEHCHIHSNGIENDVPAHNCYISGIGATFQFNRLGPLRKDCQGVGFKSRAARTVFRHNWVEGGTHCITIPETKSQFVLDDPGYRETFVYGNILLKDDRYPNNQVIHYGGELGDPKWYRKGVLYFFNNTVIADRNRGTVMFQISTPDETVDCRNNIVHQLRKSGRTILLAKDAKLRIQNNWFTENWRMTIKTRPSSAALAANHSGSDPGFRNAALSDYQLTADSPCVNTAISHRPIQHQYRRHQQQEARPNLNSANEPKDLGAFGFNSNAPARKQL